MKIYTIRHGETDWNKERKAQGDVVDYWYRLTLTKAFTDEKEPDRDVQITYGV